MLLACISVILIGAVLYELRNRLSISALYIDLIMFIEMNCVILKQNVMKFSDLGIHCMTLMKEQGLKLAFCEFPILSRR